MPLFTLMTGKEMRGIHSTLVFFPQFEINLTLKCLAIILTK